MTHLLLFPRCYILSLILGAEEKRHCINKQREKNLSDVTHYAFLTNEDYKLKDFNKYVFSVDSDLHLSLFTSLSFGKLKLLK